MSATAKLLQTENVRTCLVADKLYNVPPRWLETGLGGTNCRSIANVKVQGPARAINIEEPSGLVKKQNACDALGKYGAQPFVW